MHILVYHHNSKLDIDSGLTPRGEFQFRPLQNTFIFLTGWGIGVRIEHWAEIVL